MPDYKVKWELELSEQSPVDAVLEALEVQRDVNSLATYFTVIDMATGREDVVDLDSWSRADWELEVSAGNTILGYKDWVQHMWEGEQN